MCELLTKASQASCYIVYRHCFPDPVNVTLQQRAANAVMEQFDRMEDDDDDSEDDEVDNSLNEVPSWYMAYQRLCREGFRSMTKVGIRHDYFPSGVLGIKQ